MEAGDAQASATASTSACERAHLRRALNGDRGDGADVAQNRPPLIQLAPAKIARVAAKLASRMINSTATIIGRDRPEAVSPG